jgi:transposase
VVAGGGDPRGSGLVPGLWRAGDGPWPPPGRGARPAAGRSAGGTGVAKRLWRCTEPACPACTWSEDSDEIAPRAVLTERARAEICRRVGPGEHSVAQAARDFGVSWHAAMAAVRDHGRPRVDHLARLGAPAALGLDETSFLAATAEHPTLLVTGIIDLDSGRLVDVLAARSATAVTAWLGAKPTRWLTAIDHVVIDPYQPDATAVGAGLPEARLVVDHFHVIRLANAALDKVRRRTQQTSLGHRGHKADPLYRIRRRLLAGHERLDPTGFARVLAWLDTGDPHGEVGAAYLAKELLRESYLAVDASSPSTTTAPTATCPSSSTSPAPSPAGRPRSCAGTPPGSPTRRPRAPT